MNSHYCIIDGFSVKNVLDLPFHLIEIVLAKMNFLDLESKGFGYQSLEVRWYLLISLSGTNKLVKITILVYRSQSHFCFCWRIFLLKHSSKCKTTAINWHYKVLGFFMGHWKVYPYFNDFHVFSALACRLPEELLFFVFGAIWIKRLLGDVSEFDAHLSIVCIIILFIFLCWLTFSFLFELAFYLVLKRVCKFVLFSFYHLTLYIL